MNRKRTTVVVLAITHETFKALTWDDVIEYAARCRSRGTEMQIRRRKKTRKVRARNREIARLAASQRADEQDRTIRFEHAIN